MSQNDKRTVGGNEAEITVVGTEYGVVGQHGEVVADESLLVEIDEEQISIPWTSVRLAGIDYHGDVPDDLDMDRLTLVDGRIHAEADLDDGAIVELLPDYNAATAEFRGYERWTAERFDDPVASDGGVVYQREEVSR